MILDDYELGAAVGAGASSVVVRGVERSTGRVVAIKRTRVVTNDDRERFAREVGALRLLSHPGIARWVADGPVDAAGSEFALVTEWIEGESMAARIARGRLAEDETTTLVLRLSEALEHVHAVGVVHRDVKPANVVLGPRGPVLVDFGIARGRDDAELTVAGSILGTPSFMAPEQVRGASGVDARADVYGLGATWFAGLAGRPPFAADSNLALLAMVLLDDAPDVRAFAPAVSERTARAIARMLEKDPALRPATMAAVRARLAPQPVEAVTARERRWTTLLLASPSEPLDAELVRRRSATTVARFGESLVATFADGSASERALAACGCALELAGSRPAASIVVATEKAEAGAPLRPAEGAVRMLGQPGVFVDAATAALVERTYDAVMLEVDGERARGLHRLAARTREVETTCVGRERERRTLAMLFDECEAERVVRVAIVSGEPGVGKSHLVRALAVDLAPRSRTLRATGSPAMRGVGFALVRQLVELDLESIVPEPRARNDEARTRVRDALAGSAPVVVAIDDAQWADPPSVGVIEAALGEISDRAVLVLIATREEDDPALAPFRRRGALDLRLGRLASGASLALASSLVGESGAAQLIAARAGGHPLSIAELARAHRAGARELPVTVAGALEARIGRAPASARQVLRAAAIVGTTFDASALTPLVPNLDVNAELGVLRALDFVHGRQGRLEFDHDLLREAAYEMLDPADRALGHRIHAAWLAGTGAPPSTVARHWALAGERAAAAVAWVAALHAANVAGDRAGALHAYEAGLGCAESSLVRGELEAAVAEAHRWAGDQDAVTLHAERALALLPDDSPARFAAMAEASSAASSTARRERVARVGIELGSVDAERLGPDARAAWIDASLRVLTHLVVVDAKEPFDVLLAVVAPHAERDGRPVIAARLARVRSQLAHRLGDLSGFARYLGAALAQLERAGDRRNATILRLSAGHAAMQLGAWKRARGLLEDALADALRLRLGDVQWVIRLNLALVTHRLGSAESAAAAREVAEHFAAHHNHRLEGSARAYLAGILVEQREHTAARAEAERAMALGEGHPQVIVLAATSLARVKLAEREADAALVAAERGIALLDSIIDEGEADLRLVHVEALRAVGRHEDARARLLEARARIERTAASLGEDALSFLRIPAHVRTLELAQEST